jgi:thiol-disulfide isomerase/thioredoxin
MLRGAVRHIVALLLALIALGGVACARRADSVAPPTASPAAVATPGGASSSFSSKYIGSGLPRDAPEAPVDLYAVEAVDLASGLAWLNTGHPLALAQLRGKVVLVHFWDYGCVDCIYDFPDLERLQRKYADHLVVIGVHSAQLPDEDPIEGLRQVLERVGITHPVVYDPRQRTWYDWGVEASPTSVLIDPAGNLAHVRAGGGVYRAFRPLIGALIESFGDRGELDDTPLEQVLK